MKCELCATNDSGNRRICQDCFEMIGRLAVVDRRMHCREQSAAERLADISGVHQAASTRG